MSLMLHGADIQLSGLYEPSSEKISRLLSALMSSTRLASGREAFRSSGIFGRAVSNNNSHESTTLAMRVCRSSHRRHTVCRGRQESHVERQKRRPVIRNTKTILRFTGPPYRQVANTAYSALSTSARFDVPASSTATVSLFESKEMKPSVTSKERRFAFRIHHDDGSFLDHGQHRLMVGQDAHSAFGGGNGNRTSPCRATPGGQRRRCSPAYVDPAITHRIPSACRATSSRGRRCRRCRRMPAPGTSSYTPSQMRVKASMVSSAGT